MTTEESRRFAAESRRVATRASRPLWIGLATILLVVLYGGLRIGIPIYRQQVAIREIGKQRGFVESYDPIPNWIVRLITIWPALHTLESERVVLRDVHLFDLCDGPGDDGALACVRAFPHVRHIDLTCARVTDA